MFKKSNEIVINPNQTTTMQSYNTKIIGDIVGHDGVNVKGIVDGCIITDNIVIVRKDAEVKGKIQAYHVVVEGEVKGRIECDFLEVKKDAIVKANIEAREIKVGGKVQGEVICYDLTLEEGGYIGTKVQSNRLTSSGTVMGDMSVDTLLLKDSSYVKGNIYVNSFMNEGASVKGEIGEYKKLLNMRTSLSPNQAQNLKDLKSSIEKYIKNSEFINEILRQKTDLDVKVENLIGFIRENIGDSEEIKKVSRLINYKG